ncbi:MAG: GNAT family N-acetyltransferase [Ferruginibacter sp.]
MNITYNNFFDQDIILENEIVRIEPLQQKHFEPLLPVAVNDDIWRYKSVQIRSAADFKKYFDTAITEKQTKKAYPFAFYDKINNKYAGSTRFGNIDFNNKRLEIGWTWIDQPLHGTGFNKNCKYLLLNFGFDTLNLNRIELKTSLTNLRSQKAMLKIGAVKEGVFRSHSINEDGSIRNSVFFSFIKPEWEQTKQDFFPDYINRK